MKTFLCNTVLDKPAKSSSDIFDQNVSIGAVTSRPDMFIKHNVGWQFSVIKPALNMIALISNIEM